MDRTDNFNRTRLWSFSSLSTKLTQTKHKNQLVNSEMNYVVVILHLTYFTLDENADWLWEYWKLMC